MGKPQDLPAGDTQMYIAIAFNFITYIVALFSFTGFGRAVLHSAVDLASTGLLLYVGLLLFNRLPRFEQAYGAICGAGAILNLAAIPMLQLSRAPEGVQQSDFAMFSWIVLLMWNFSMVGHVLRFTFSVSIFVGIVAAVIYYLLISTLLGWLFPAESAADSVSMLFSAATALT